MTKLAIYGTNPPAIHLLSKLGLWEALLSRKVIPSWYKHCFSPCFLLQHNFLLLVNQFTRELLLVSLDIRNRSQLHGVKTSPYVTMVFPDNVDESMLAAERQASRDRYAEQARLSHEVERVHSSSSSSSTSSHISAIRSRPTGNLERVPTQRDLERQATVLSRIQTAKSQHSATVGRSIKSRKSNKPLPNFGAGKPYPPPLPEREEYVVEFDGPDDPLHAMNWPLRKK